MSHTHTSSSCFAVLLVLAAVTGCRTQTRLDDLDRRAFALVKDAHAEAAPEEALEDLDLGAFEAPDPADFATPVAVDLRRCLALAARHSRGYQSAKEALFSAAISLRTGQHDWEWNPTNSLASLLTRDFGASDTTLSGDASIGVSRRLLSGARLTGSLALDALRYLSGNRDVSISSLAQLTLTQPLLAGAGPLQAREALTQAERNLIYALRSYVRTRQGLVIDIAEGYYAVLGARDGLDTARRNHENLRDSRARSEDMAEAGRIPPFEVDEARQDELSAHSTLIDREAAYRARKDELKRSIGLPLTAQIDIDQSDLDKLIQSNLDADPVSFDRACDVALDCRLDYRTVKDQLEDARRAVLLARNAMLPTLDFTASVNAAGPADARLRGIAFENATVSAGLTGELPFDKTDETAALRRAMLSQAEQERDVRDTHDQIIAGLRSVWRSLKASEQNLKIHQLSVTLAERRIENLELLFQAGRVDMRRVLDARDALITAKNSATNALVTRRLSWLRFLYQIGKLPVEADTLWSQALDGRAPNLP